MNGILAVGVQTKTYVTSGLAILAVLEFVTAMYVFGRKGEKKHRKGILWLHRTAGYLFLIYWLWPIWVGFGLLERLSDGVHAGPIAHVPGTETGWRMDTRVFFHALLGVLVPLLLLLKISFIRIYMNYRPHARLLGILITVGAIVTWLIAGWFWLGIVGSRAAQG